MINLIDGYVDVTREFNNVPDEYVVWYSDSTDEYNVINVVDEFCELNTQTKKKYRNFLMKFIITMKIKNFKF